MPNQHHSPADRVHQELCLCAILHARLPFPCPVVAVECLQQTHSLSRFRVGLPLADRETRLHLHGLGILPRPCRIPYRPGCYRNRLSGSVRSGEHTEEYLSRRRGSLEGKRAGRGGTGRGQETGRVLEPASIAPGSSCLVMLFVCRLSHAPSKSSGMEVGPSPSRDGTP